MYKNVCTKINNKFINYIYDHILLLLYIHPTDTQLFDVNIENNTQNEGHTQLFKGNTKNHTQIDGYTQPTLNY